MKTPKLLAPVAVVLVAAVAVSGATCWRMAAGSFDLAACDGEYFTTAEALVPPFDYVEIRDTTRGEPATTKGEKCAAASDKTKCAAAIDAATSTEGWSNGSNGRMPGYTYAVLNRGDEVIVVDQRTRTMASVLTPIDSPRKAALVASLTRNLNPSCKKSVRAATGGWEVHLATDSCFGPREETVLVRTTGEVEIVSEWHGEQTCIGAVLPAGTPAMADAAAKRVMPE
ncbi:MAG: hypothetical protein U0228_22660 [Myxococcaceae bacterium]